MSLLTIRHFLNPFTVTVEGRYRRVGGIFDMCLGRVRYSLDISTVTIEGRDGGGGTHVIAWMLLVTFMYSAYTSTITA